MKHPTNPRSNWEPAPLNGKDVCAEFIDENLSFNNATTGGLIASDDHFALFNPKLVEGEYIIGTNSIKITSHDFDSANLTAIEITELINGCSDDYLYAETDYGVITDDKQHFVATIHLWCTDTNM